jgi:hypothetical protein
MSHSVFLPLLAGSCSLVIGLIARWSIIFGQERRAYGDGRSALSWADRREIRRAVRAGRPVADPRLAVPAVRYGEEVGATFARLPAWRVHPPRWLYIFGRIFFPLLGTMGLVLGITDHDPVGVVSGIVLLAFTVLYLPVTERWTIARRLQRDRRLQDFIDANRRLLGGAA